MDKATLSRAAKRAIAKYGKDKCLTAYNMNRVKGYGANSIGIELGLTTNQADAAINAGEELLQEGTAQPLE